MNIYIVQPMVGLNSDQIALARKRIIDEEIPYYLKHIPQEWLSYLNPKDYTILDQRPLDDSVHELIHIARDLEILAQADLVYFSEGYNISRECRLIYTCAKEYKKYLIVSYPNKSTDYVSPTMESYSVFWV
ncbi:MAG: hypothetical protein NC489_08010 [Ruminococcus flavefaciens]|nr:hypothetical protein [Ruminococcus flavefaciens]